MSFYQYNSTKPINPVGRTNRCIILDVDESLLHTFDDEQYKRFNELKLMSDPNLIDLRSRLYVLPLLDLSHTGSDSLNLLWGIFRPGLKDFLHFSESYFSHVCVWSAGEYDYVHNVCRQIFRGLPYPEVIFTRDDCEKIGNHYRKPIANMLKHPILMASGVRPEDTLILDDRATTFSANPGNGVLIPAYSPNDNIEDLRRNDTALNSFSQWLLNPEVLRTPDVRMLDKTRIFM